MYDASPQRLVTLAKEHQHLVMLTEVHAALMLLSRRLHLLTPLSPSRILLEDRTSPNSQQRELHLTYAGSPIAVAWIQKSGDVARFDCVVGKSYQRIGLYSVLFRAVVGRDTTIQKVGFGGQLLESENAGQFFRKLRSFFDFSRLENEGNCDINKALVGKEAKALSSHIIQALEATSLHRVRTRNGFCLERIFIKWDWKSGWSLGCLHSRQLVSEPAIQLYVSARGPRFSYSLTLAGNFHKEVVPRLAGYERMVTPVVDLVLSRKLCSSTSVVMASKLTSGRQEIR
jgi:hypothetical protein